MAAKGEMANKKKQSLCLKSFIRNLQYGVHDISKVYLKFQ